MNSLGSKFLKEHLLIQPILMNNLPRKLKLCSTTLPLPGAFTVHQEKSYILSWVWYLFMTIVLNTVFYKFINDLAPKYLTQ